MTDLFRRLRRAHSRRSRGQGLVEFALVAPILILVLGTVVQFGYIFSAQVGVINATREAARNAAATVPTLDTGAASTNGDYAYQRLLDTWLPDNVMAYDPAAVGTTGTTRTQVCYARYGDPSGLTAIQVSVTTVYKHRLFVPLLANLLDLFDGSSDGRLWITSSETMRVANPEQRPSYVGNIPASPGICYQ
jgi:Flp pilus assembly protein TadG